MVVHTCNRCGKEFPKLAKLRIHLGRKNPCKAKLQNPTPESEVIHELAPEPNQLSNQKEFDEIETMKEQGLWEYAKRVEFKSRYRTDGQFHISYVEPPLEEMTNFEEVKYGDPERPHQNNLMSVWQIIIPSAFNPKYSFNKPLE